MMSENILVTSEMPYYILKFYMLETILACQVP